MIWFIYLLTFAFSFLSSNCEVFAADSSQRQPISKKAFAEDVYAGYNIKDSEFYDIKKHKSVLSDVHRRKKEKDKEDDHVYIKKQRYLRRLQKEIKNRAVYGHNYKKKIISIDDEDEDEDDLHHVISGILSSYDSSTGLGRRLVLGTALNLGAININSELFNVSDIGLGPYFDISYEFYNTKKNVFASVGLGSGALFSTGIAIPDIGDFQSNNLSRNTLIGVDLHVKFGLIDSEGKNGIYILGGLEYYMSDSKNPFGGVDIDIVPALSLGDLDIINKQMFGPIMGLGWFIGITKSLRIYNEFRINILSLHDNDISNSIIAESIVVPSGTDLFIMSGNIMFGLQWAM